MHVCSGSTTYNLHHKPQLVKAGSHNIPMPNIAIEPHYHYSTFDLTPQPKDDSFYSTNIAKSISSRAKKDSFRSWRPCQKLMLAMVAVLLMTAVAMW